METSLQDPSLYEFMIKLLVLGDPQTGKSSFVAKFCNNTFTSTYAPTSGVNFKYKMLDFNSKKVKVQVWDTAGSDYSNSLLKIYYKKAMGIMLLFSFEDPKSLENIDIWMQHIQSNANPNAIVVLVGNKADSTKKAVKPQDIKAIQKKYKFARYFDTSVMEGLNVNETFTELVKDVKDKIDGGLLKVEEMALNTNATATPEKKLGTNILNSLGFKNKEELKSTPTKQINEGKDYNITGKGSEEHTEKRINTVVELAKKELSFEIEEIRQSTKQELEIKLSEEIDKLRKEFIETANKKSKIERDQSGKKEGLQEKQKDEENLQALKGEIRWLTKAFEGLKSSISEDFAQAKIKTEKSLDTYAKENIIFEERLIHLEAMLKDMNTNNRNSQNDKALKFENVKTGLKARSNSNQAPQNTSGVSDSQFPDKVESPPGRSVQVKMLNLGSEKPKDNLKYNQIDSSDRNSDDYNVSLIRDHQYESSLYEKKRLGSNDRETNPDSLGNSNGLEGDTEKVWKHPGRKNRSSEYTSPITNPDGNLRSQYSSNYYGQDTHKAQEQTEKHHESIVETSLLDENTNQDEALKNLESKYDNIQPKSISLGNIDDGLARTVIDLKHSVALIEEETNKLQRKFESIETKKQTARSRNGQRSSRTSALLRKGSSVSKGQNDSSSEIASLWETINNLVKNTHEEIDKMKEELRLFSAKNPNSITAIPEAFIEKNLYGIVAELRDDVHNQLIEIQRELEGSYAAFRTSLIGNYEGFLGCFHLEQNKLKKYMEERCGEIVEEALGKIQTNVISNQSSPGKRCFSATTSPEPRRMREGNIEVQINTVGIMIDRRSRGSLQTKISGVESQQRQMLNSYSAKDSFKGIWETVHILTHKVSKLEERDLYIEGVSKIGKESV